jgi:hypothetical protein
MSTRFTDIAGSILIPGIIPTGNLLWVDAVNGNDSLAVRGRLSVPFKTLSAAKNAAVSGDTMLVLPGTYNDQDLAKDGVNWHFIIGASVVGSGGTAIFRASTGMTFKVTGYGAFTSATYILEVTAAATIFFQCKSMINATPTCIRITSGSEIIVEADDISSQESSTIDVTGGTIHVRARRIYCESAHAINLAGASINIDAYNIVSGYVAALRVAGAGALTVRAQEIKTEYTGHTIEYNNSSNTGTVLVRGARIVSPDDRCVYFASGGNTSPPTHPVVRLDRCVLIAGGGESIGSAGGASAKVLVYSLWVANVAKAAAITLVGAGFINNDSEFV